MNYKIIAKYIKNIDFDINEPDNFYHYLRILVIISLKLILKAIHLKII